MLIVFPLGLLGMSVAFDVAYLSTGSARFADVAYWMTAAGVATGLLAAGPGWLDWTKIPSGTRAKAVGLWHGLGNVVVLCLFAGSFALRYDRPADPPTTAMMLSAAGLMLALVTGW